MKLHTYYSIDECIDETKLFARLDELVDESKLQYTKEDKWLIKIIDVDLTEIEEIELADFLESLEVFQFSDLDDEEFDDFNSFEDDDYGSNKRGSRYDDDY